MKKTRALLSMMGYAVCGVCFLLLLIFTVWLIPSLFGIDAHYVGSLFVVLAVVESFLLLFSIWGLLTTLVPGNKWSMPFFFVVLIIVGALAFPLIPLSVQTNDSISSEMNLFLLTIFPHFLWAYVMIGNIPGAVLLLIGLLQKQEKIETSHSVKETIVIDFGAKDEMSLEVERFKSLYKEGLLTEEEAQKQIRDLEMTVL